MKISDAIGLLVLGIVALVLILAGIWMIISGFDPAFSFFIILFGCGFAMGTAAYASEIK